MTTPRGRIVRVAAAVAVLAIGGLARLGPAEADSVQEPAKVSREAYFTSPITQSTPGTLRNGFPPGTACLVAGLAGVPQVCGTEVQQIAALLGLSDGLPVPITPDGDLAQPIVLPGTTPVGMFGGQQRYASLIKLDLPPLPAGQRFASFELVLHQDGVNFAIESPALRNVVLQLLGQVTNRDPAKLADAIGKAISGEVPLATEMITGIEACPITEPWNGGRAQGAALDGTRLPDTDCLTGTTAVFDEAEGTWTFDLTFAVAAWAGDGEGSIANEGVMLRPVGAPNFAYGDPDISTNWVVSLADSTAAAGLRPMVRYTTVASEDISGGGGFVEVPVDLGPFPSDGPVDFGPIPDPSSGGGGSSLGALRARWAELESTGGSGSTPGWVWLALPLGLTAAFLFGQSLGATPAALRRRPGALTHLEAARANAAAAADEPGVKS